MATAEWTENHFYLPKESADKHGLFDFYYAPYLRPICEALDDPQVKEVVCMKAAQVAWTTILIAYICKRISRQPCTIVGMFAKEGDAKSFSDEKLGPTISVTPEVSDLVDVSTSRKAGNRSLFKKFPGGILKLVGSNSPGSVKSTPAEVVFVEEPDDANVDLKKQGDSIDLLWERTKRKAEFKRIMGGTPSVKGLSRVEEHINRSDQRVFLVPCHDCDEYHVLNWANVTWLEAEESQVKHIVYGNALPETAVYNCPHCGSIWDDDQRKNNIRKLKWEATAPFNGTAGFKELSEIYSCLPGVTLADMVIDHLNAEHKAKMGDESAKVVFVNSKLGRPYEYSDKDSLPENIEDAALDYEEMAIPHGGLVVTAGIDVQHDRLAIIIRAHGRGRESWLLHWGEISAKVSVTDMRDPVWKELDKILFSQIKSSAGWSTNIRALTIDSSDGTTNDAVYTWVRSRQKKHPQVLIMAGKGSSAQTDPEIFVTPSRKSIDHKRPDKVSKADRHGVKVHIVGTNKAKDLIAGQLKLECNPKADGLFHIYKNVRTDYYAQITAEIKAPHRSIRGRKVWQLKSGCRNEALDCEVYALHASRAVRLHLMTPAQWDALEAKLSQQDLFQEIAPEAPAASATPKSLRQTNTVRRTPQRSTGFVNNWKK